MYEEVVERIWPGRKAQVTVLGGGITNHNLKVELDGGDAFVLRISGSQTGLLGIDRRVEYEASLAAAAVGVGPEVVAFVEPEGYLVTRFIEGEVVPLERMREPDVIRRVAAALRPVHNGPPLSRRFDAFRIVEGYRSTASLTAHPCQPSTSARARSPARSNERAGRSRSDRVTTTC